MVLGRKFIWKQWFTFIPLLYYLHRTFRCHDQFARGELWEMSGVVIIDWPSLGYNWILCSFDHNHPIWLFKPHSYQHVSYVFHHFHQLQFTFPGSGCHDDGVTKCSKVQVFFWDSCCQTKVQTHCFSSLISRNAFYLSLNVNTVAETLRVCKCKTDMFLQYGRIFLPQLHSRLFTADATGCSGFICQLESFLFGSLEMKTWKRKTE